MNIQCNKKNINRTLFSVKVKFTFKNMYFQEDRTLSYNKKLYNNRFAKKSKYP
jgi:hypothetical protein